MAKQDKVEEKLYKKPPPTDLHWDELRGLLLSKGYREIQGSGSRVKFHHPEHGDALISIHKPHPSGILKRYQIKDVIEALEALKNE
jgi:predicted RNA binding protein YcfA (HicA-like mRNA interferase family)